MGGREQHQAALAAYRFDNGPLLDHEQREPTIREEANDKEREADSLCASSLDPCLFNLSLLPSLHSRRKKDVMYEWTFSLLCPKRWEKKVLELCLLVQVFSLCPMVGCSGLLILGYSLSTPSLIIHLHTWTYLVAHILAEKTHHIDMQLIHAAHIL